jgi:hypothetical protein
MPDKEGLANPLLKKSHLMAHCGLRQSKLIRRLTETFEPRCSLETQKVL